MYREIFSKYSEMLTGFPRTRRPRIGSIIKEIRIDKGIPQKKFTELIGINESTFKSIENDHQKATTIDNLERCAKALGKTSPEIILLGRERDPANIFAFKKTPPPLVSGIRKRKQTPEEWHQSIRLRVKEFDLIPISPPINMRKDFFAARISLPPKRSIPKCSLGTHRPVLGFVSEGFNLKINYGGDTIPLTSNQAFSLDGCYPHDIINDDEDHTAILYLVTKFPDFSSLRISQTPSKSAEDMIRISRGIEAVRKHRCERPGKILSINHLAALTDNLDHMQIHKMMRLKGSSSVAYWEKIEDLLGAAGITMEEFLNWTKNKQKMFFSLATPKTRVLIDAEAFYGVRIYAAVPPGMNNDYFCGEMTVEGKKDKGGKMSWERKDNAMIALYVEEGELEVTVGRRRSPLPLLKGESIYFDGSLGYIIRNPAKSGAKAFLAAHPAIQF